MWKIISAYSKVLNKKKIANKSSNWTNTTHISLIYINWFHNKPIPSTTKVKFIIST
jgi:hypothetical protein